MAVEIESDLAASLRYATEQLKFWQKQREALVARVIEAAGADPVVTVDGRQRWSNNPINGYRTAAFRKEHPDVAAYFTKVERRDVEYIDWDALKVAQPELHDEYQSRSFREVDN